MTLARLIEALLLAGFAGTSILGNMQHATANVLRWNLQNVIFTDGAIAAGFFDLDAARGDGPIADFDVKVTGGKYPPLEYSRQNSEAFRFGTDPGCQFNCNPRAELWSPNTSSAKRQLTLGTPALIQGGTYPLTSVSNRFGSFQKGLSYEQDFGITPVRWVRSVSTSYAPRLIAPWHRDRVLFEEK